MARGISAIAIGNLASKGAGLVREIAFAGWFGTSGTAAAFRIAQTAYLLPTQAFVGDSLGAGLLPLYRNVQQEGVEPPRLLVAVASLYALGFSAVVTTLLYLYASEVAAFIAPGAQGKVLALAARLLKILSLATPFYVLSGMLSYLETAYGQYGAIAWRPMLLNLGALGGAALAVWLGKDYWLATGIFISHIAFFVWTLIQLQRLGGFWLSKKPALFALKQVSARFLANLVPLLGLPLAAQVNVVVERIVSSHLGSAVIPSVDYARFICDTSVQLVAVPLGILTMSTHGGRSGEAIRAHVSGITRALLVLSFPIAAFIGSNAENIVRLIYKRGVFDAHSVDTTASVLVWMGGALGMTITAYYLVKALNAQMRNKEALLATLVAVGTNMSVNLLLWRWLGAPTIGLAVAAYAAVLLIACLTLLKLWREMRSTLAWLMVGCALQIIPAWLVSEQFAYPFGLAMNVAIAALVWLPMIFCVRTLREAVLPILSRVPVLRKV
ncbi:murein biosynthesis integral membrane protein MurJ [Dyella sp. C9]|uniref:murein biosynthesis integral membrane protein MurJ n=1 Tax=Dyella sp. C9 TaxID=2202154 RepID=UPI000DEFFE04|nr:lipid II flippase MurJ [Dyella sp. C9]